MRKQLICSVLTAVSFAPALPGQANIWLPPKCDVKGSNHFLVNGGLLHLKSATEKPANRERDLKDAQQSLTQAVTTAGQDKNGAAWYYLGRYYVMVNNAAGADSAFKKAESLLPTCREDISFYRRNQLWIPIAKAGQNALNAQHYDSAVALLTAGAQVYDGEPQAFTILATAYFNIPAASYLPESTFRKANPGLSDSAASAQYEAATRTHFDSAAKYFRLGAQAAGTDTRFANEKKDAMYNVGNAFYGAQRYDSAAAAYRDYLKLVPNDAQARARLADVLSMGGHKDSAMATYAQIIQNADSAEPMSLFNAGASIYNAAPPLPDTARISAACRRTRATGQTVLQRKTKCDHEAADSLAQRDSAAATNYRLAAQAFEAGLAREPLNRDGLYNLTTSYFALRQADKMLPVAQRLVVVDPMNRNSVRMLAQAWQLKKQGDSALFYVTISDSLLPVDVSVGGFGPTEQGATLSGVVTNYHSKASAPLKLVFEFLNKAGAVVTTTTADVPAIDGNGTHAFQVQASGAGIIAWRYKKG